MDDSSRRLILFSVLSFAAAGVIFFCAGWFGNDADCADDGSALSSQDAARLALINAQLADKLFGYPLQSDLGLISTETLAEYESELSAVPHLAGSARDEALVDYIAERWREQGLDHVEVVSYRIRLSVPDPARPNQVQMADENGVFFNSSYRESIPDLDENFVDAYLAYTPPAEVSGDVVYVNYGTVDDFAFLDSLDNVTARGKICLARYGKIFRGNKVVNGAEAGCIGVILFSDPEDVAGLGTEPGSVYPETIFLPGDGIERGTTYIKDGDPPTPNWPSLEKAYRLDDAELSLMKIPAQPIGYDDATQILRQLDGTPAPDAWVGQINATYYLGGQFKASCVGCRVLLKTYNRLETRDGKDVVGVIRGEFEPDRYVMVGNHRDAWGYGAVDPSSGTAQMLETSRVLGERLKIGWRPRRSIVFASWAAEEFGLIGSREFVEDYLSKLMHRTVAYINVDRCASGPILLAEASPTVGHKVIEATKIVENPWNPSESYYDFWANWSSPEVPAVKLPGSASDHANFIFYAGIPIIKFGLDRDTKEYPTLKNAKYPTYHTGYETTYLMSNLIDPGGLILKTCTALSLVLARTFSDPLLLDFDPMAYFEVMDYTMNTQFVNDTTLDQLEELGVDITPVQAEIASFGQQAQLWKGAFRNNTAKESDPLMARQLNEQQYKLDSLFLLNEGLPDRPEVRHAILSPSKFDSYGASTFPGITDLLHDYDDLLTPNQKERRVEELKKHVSDLMIVIKAAKEYLEETHLI